MVKNTTVALVSRCTVCYTISCTRLSFRLIKNQKIRIPQPIFSFEIPINHAHNVSRQGLIFTSFQSICYIYLNFGYNSFICECMGEVWWLLQNKTKCERWVPMLGAVVQLHSPDDFETIPWLFYKKRRAGIQVDIGRHSYKLKHLRRKIGWLPIYPKKHTIINIQSRFKQSQSKQNIY